MKFEHNPVLGGKLGTCFDVSVLKEGNTFRMWFSWRPKESVALVESADGIHWSEPRIVLGPRKETGWEDKVNRPVVIKRGDGYHMWYTGQSEVRSSIGYATSADGIAWKRMSDKPALAPQGAWEKVAVMCPHVLWDTQANIFRMWYSAGEQGEPNAIGYAASPDGVTWTRHPGNPIFTPDPANAWEKHKVTACQVIPYGSEFVMFYIGFRDEGTAQIGLARSKDGITGWQRHAANPLVRVGQEKWDHDACYKPYAIFDGTKWLLWYNGRRGPVEQIGLATHEGENLGFDEPAAPQPAAILAPDKLRQYVETFNKHDQEVYRQHVPNSAAAKFLEENIPLLDCPDKEIEEIYYFRWWTFRKHIRQTRGGFVITEFLPPVSWAGKHNTINCAAGHHLYEGRWLREPKYLDDYSTFWFRKGGDPRRYSFWAADAYYARWLVNQNEPLLVGLLPDLVKNFEAWEKERRDANGLYWQNDGQDGMEVSIGGTGYRATINSYMYGDAVAIARIADLAGKKEIATAYRDKAAKIKQLLQEKLWDSKAEFFKVSPRGEVRLADVREQHGLTPWYFNLPDPQYCVAWKQLIDPQGFSAPFGPTTAERRHPKFAVAYTGHECQWNGPSWPYSTAVTLTGMANVLNNYQQDAISKRDYLDVLKIYTMSHHLKRDDGQVAPWIDENLNPLTGDWLSRTLLRQRKQQPLERGKDYNHSSYCDLVITGLIGLRPRADNTIEVHPLAPEGTWDYFCLDRVPYHGRTITILYDKTGKHYGKGKGLRIFADGREIAAADGLQRLTGSL